MPCQPQLGSTGSISLHALSLLMEIRGRTVTSPSKNNLLKQESLFYLFLHAVMLLHSAVKSLPDDLYENVNNITGWCELIKFLELQGLGKQQHSVWNCRASCPESMVFLPGNPRDYGFLAW